MVFYCNKNTENGGGVNFAQFWAWNMALGHVYDMRCLGKYMYQHRNVEKNSLWSVIAIIG